MWRKLFPKKQPDQTISQPAPKSMPPVDPQTRPAAIPSWYRKTNPSIDERLEALAKGNAEKRRQVVLTMIRNRWSASTYNKERLVELAKDSEKSVRVAAVRAIGLLNSDALPTLIEALDDPHRGVRLEAIGAMKTHWAAGEPLVKILKGPDRQLHAAAATALGYQTGDAVVPALIDALGQSYTTITRRKAARSLARRRDVRAVAPLLEGIADANPNVRVIMAHSLRMLISHLQVKFNGDAIKTLKLSLDHTNPLVQLHAAYNLALIGNPAGVAVLKNALLDERPPYLTKAQIQEALNQL